MTISKLSKEYIQDRYNNKKKILQFKIDCEYFLININSKTFSKYKTLV